MGEDRSVRKEIPAPIREIGMRRTLKISPLPQDEYWVGIARTQDELQAAFSLLHDCYVGQKIMDPDPSGLRCNIFQALPYTTTMIAKHGDKVVGTVALIKDSPVGFPSDKSYPDENSYYRRKDFKMAEASALAVHKDYRSYGHRVSLPLMKYLILYAIRYMDVSMLVATVHPRSRDFYAGLLNFHQNGGILEYGFAKGALACHLTMDTRALEGWMEKIYRAVPDEQNFYRYMFESDDPALHFPDRPKECAFDPVMTPELLRYFFAEKTRVFQDTPARQLGYVRAAYSPFYDLSGVPILRDASESKPFRFSTKISAAWVTAARVLIGTIYDLTGGGAFFSSPEGASTGERGELIFNIGKTLYRIPSQVAWTIGVSALHLPQGFGIRFFEQRSELIDLLHGVSVPPIAAQVKMVGKKSA